MPKQDRPKRKYHSIRRKEQAQETRRRLLSAALKLFSEHGYTGATIEAIAEEAGVSPLTVFAVFGNKRSILTSLVGISVGGDDQSIPLLQRPGPKSVLQEMDPTRQIQLFATDIADILERVTPVFEIMRMAAKTEREIAELLSNILEERLQNLGVFVQHLSAHNDLREGLDDSQATEIVWTIASPDVYRLLTVERGWPKERFSQWLSDALTRLLLP
jgi:AcrR family transcriptional regulator